MVSEREYPSVALAEAKVSAVRKKVKAVGWVGSNGCAE
jgi:hypothetical protein